MKHSIVYIDNVARLHSAGDALLNRSPDMPGVGLVWGETGFGKTTASVWWLNRVHGVYVRALSLWTPGSMLGAILRELDEDPRGSSCAQMVERIVRALGESQRPLFVDEADYLIDQKRLVETLRDIHDLATVPVILIGMADIKHKIGRRPQLSGRVAQEIQFQPCTLDDARLLAKELCEVRVDAALVRRLHEAAKGSVRLMVVGLYRIEQHARSKGLECIGAADWKLGDVGFFTGPAPQGKAAPVANVG